MNADFSALRVLLVDDQRDVRRWVRHQLTLCGVRDVVEAADGEAAIAVLLHATQRFDLVLCDLTMAGMDGTEAIARMAELGVSAAVSILSGGSGAAIGEAAETARRGGLTLVGEHVKPLTVEKLQDILQRSADISSQRARAERAEPVATAGEVEFAYEAMVLEFRFQPIVTVKDWRCVGAEASVRWAHPVRGSISAEAVLPLVARSPERLVQLTDDVLRTAARACSAWRADHRRLGVWVALPSAMLSQDDLPARAAAVAQDAALPPEAVTLCVADFAIGDGTRVAVSTVRQLHARGFGLALDCRAECDGDATALDVAPFTEVRVPADCLRESSSTAPRRVRALAALDAARRRGLPTASTGAVLRADWDHIEGLGCTRGQGDFIARAATEAGFTSWARRWMSAEPA